MKRIITLGVLAAVLAALIIGFVLLKSRTPAQEAGAETERVAITDLDREAIEEMILETEDGTLRLTREGEQAEWKAEHEVSVELDETAVTDLEFSFAGLYAEEVVEEKPEDLAQYGLDPPQAVATARLSDGSETVLHLGSQTTNLNKYYLKTADEPTVYTVWVNHANHFRYGLSDVRSRTLPSVDLREMQYLMIARDGRVTMEVVRKEALARQPLEYALGSLFLTAPYPDPRPIAADRWNDVFVSKFPTLRIERFADDRPESLAPYGLDEPRWELLVKDPDGILHLYIGDEVDDLVYFKQAGKPAVHMVKDDIVEVLSVKPFTVMDKFAFIINIDHVDRLRIRGLGRDHTLSIERKTVTRQVEAADEGAEDRGPSDEGGGEGSGGQGTETVTEVQETFYLDGREVDEDQFKRMYQSAIGLLVDAPYSPPVSGEPEVSLVYTMNKGGVDTFRIEFVPYDDDFYAVFKNGGSEFLIGRSQVEDMLSDLDRFVEGKLER